jgi:hypothetical protein
MLKIDGLDINMTPVGDPYEALVSLAQPSNVDTTVSAWDANCSQHIPQRFESAEFSAALAERDKRIEMLEAELRRLREIDEERNDRGAGAVADRPVAETRSVR